MTEEESKPLIDLSDKNYTKTKSANGSKSKHNNDIVAQALNGLSLETVYDIAQEMTEIHVTDLLTKYEHLNAGQQRMSLGNRIRGAITKMDKIADHEGGISGAAYFRTIMTGYELTQAS